MIRPCLASSPITCLGDGTDGFFPRSTDRSTLVKMLVFLEQFVDETKMKNSPTAVCKDFLDAVDFIIRHNNEMEEN